MSIWETLLVGGQAAAAIAINWLVAALHGCSLYKDDGTEFCLKCTKSEPKDSSYLEPCHIQ